MNLIPHILRQIYVTGPWCTVVINQEAVKAAQGAMLTTKQFVSVQRVLEMRLKDRRSGDVMS